LCELLDLLFFSADVSDALPLFFEVDKEFLVLWLSAVLFGLLLALRFLEYLDLATECCIVVSAWLAFDIFGIPYPNWPFAPIKASKVTEPARNSSSQLMTLLQFVSVLLKGKLLKKLENINKALGGVFGDMGVDALEDNFADDLSEFFELDAELLEDNVGFLLLFFRFPLFFAVSRPMPVWSLFCKALHSGHM
jgi:hypothetical protein